MKLSFIVLVASLMYSFTVSAQWDASCNWTPSMLGTYQYSYTRATAFTNANWVAPNGTVTSQWLSADSKTAFCTIYWNNAGDITLTIKNSNPIVSTHSVSIGCPVMYAPSFSVSNSGGGGSSSTTPVSFTIDATTGSGGSSVWWYTTSSGGVKFHTGSSYTTSTLYTSTTYYISTFYTTYYTDGPVTCESNRVAVNLTISPPPPPTLYVESHVCGSGSAQITATPGAGGNTVKWYNASGTLLHTGILYNTPTISTSTTYYASTVQTSTGYESAQAAITANVYPIPSGPYVISGSRCGPGTVMLSATPGTGEEIRWYDNQDNFITAGNSYSPSVSSTTTYRVRSLNTNTGCISAYATATATVNAVPATPYLTPASRCGTGSVTLTGTVGIDGNMLRWYDVASGGSSLEDAMSHTTGSLSSNTTFYASSLNTTTGCESVRVPVLATIIPLPPAPTYSVLYPVCGSGSTTIAASISGEGNVVKWYSSSTGGQPVYTGADFGTPVISTTTSWYMTTYNSTTGCESAPRTQATVTVSPIPAPPTSVTNAAQCDPGSVTISATPASPADGIKWYSSSVEGIEVSNQATFITPPLEGITYYYAASYNSATGCISTARTPVEARIHNKPRSLLIGATPIYGSGTSKLTVRYFSEHKTVPHFLALSDTTDLQVLWFASKPNALAGTPLLARGIVYTTPPLTQTTIYYARLLDKTTGCLGDPAEARAVVTPFIASQSIQTDVIRVAGKKDEASLTTLTDAEKTTVITYMDGVGRVHQQVVKRGSPTGKDVIQPVDFDNFGRASKSYLPYTGTTTDGSFHSAYKVEQAVFYQAPNDKIANDSLPFSISAYEDSPLGRLIEQGGVGQAWQPGSGHTSKIMYGFNTGATSNEAEEVRKFNPDGTSTGFYPANILNRVESTDADGNKLIYFYDPQGKVIVSKQQLDEVIDGVTVNYLETYYIYDDFGSVKFMIQPKGVAELKTTSWTLSQSIKDQYVFEYVYDYRGRVIEKKVPGAGWNYIVYDQLNRPVLMQDVMVRANNQWVFLKYDSKGRVVMTGLYTDNTNVTRSSQQAVLDGKNYDASDKYFEVRQASTTHGYSNLVFPTNNTEILSVNYFDSHDFNYDLTPDQTYAVQNVAGEKTDGLLIGRPTGSKNSIPGTTTWLVKYVFYDSAGRVTQVRGNNHLNTNADDLSTMVYDFEKVLLTKNYHNAGAGKITTVVNEYEYDTQGRTKKVFQNTNGAGKQLLMQYEYNELGQMVDKKLHGTGTPGSEVFLQSVDYRYTIRGQLASINNAPLTNDGSTNDETNDYFGMELLYNTTESGLSTAQRYNGNISAIKWKSIGAENGTAGQKSYTFGYDRSGKLEAASYAVKGTTAWNLETGAENESMTYDRNGNIQTLQRAQRKHQLNGIIASYTNESIDNLTYTYKTDNGNSLIKVEDATTKDAGFKNGSTPENIEYTYDDAGNITADKNKGIDTVKYNFMGKPMRIKFSDGKVITYTYDAAGAKLIQKVYQGATLQTTTDYVNGFVYENGTLSFFGSPGGRVQMQGENKMSNADCSSTAGTSQYVNATISAVTINNQTYIKTICNQSTSTPGILMGGNIPVQPGERYVFQVRGYASTPNAVRLYVGANNATLVWNNEITGATMPHTAANETTISNEFTIPEGTSWINLGVIWYDPSTGAETYINHVALIKLAPEYQYSIADHQGNTRVVFTSVTPVEQNPSTDFETDPGTLKNFPSGGNLSSLDLFNNTPLGTKSQLLNGGNNSQVGVAKSFAVYPGDKVKIRAFGKYESGGSSASSGFATALLQAFTLPVPAPGETGTPSAGLNKWGGLVDGGAQEVGTAPQAFVNIVVYDKDHNFLDAAWDQISEDAEQEGVSPDVAHDEMIKEYTIKEAGFVYLYVSNNSPVRVYFDDVTITHTPTNVIQYNEYYPFGLQASTSWARENNKNSYLYNESSELNLSSGWYDLPFRNYDAALGRFMQVDPLAVLDNSTSPFVYAGNNPVFFNDPSGLLTNMNGYTDGQLRTMYRAERQNYSSFGEWGVDNLDSFGSREIQGTDGLSYAFNDNGQFGYWRVDTRSWAYDDEVGVIGVEANRDIFVTLNDPGRPIRTSSGGLQGAATAWLAFIAMDVAVPEPTDLAWPKWAGYAVTGAIAAAIVHSNSNNNNDPHLVYEIYSINGAGQRRTEKYGITSRENNKDGNNGRPAYQANKFNKQDPTRAYSWQTITWTKGRASAKAIELFLVTKYFMQHGELPPKQIYPLPNPGGLGPGPGTGPGMFMF